MAMRGGIGKLLKRCTGCCLRFPWLMASIDEAYVDMTTNASWTTGACQHALHHKMKAETQDLNCSIGIGGSRLIAKVSSAQAEPTGCWIVPDEARNSWLHSTCATFRAWAR